jgi:hypothetical protein
LLAKTRGTRAELQEILCDAETVDGVARWAGLYAWTLDKR